jgi:hypothetical protein
MIEQFSIENTWRSGPLADMEETELRSSLVYHGTRNWVSKLVTLSVSVLISLT